MNLWRLELLRLIRTYRWLIIGGVYLFFALSGPLLAAYLGEIIARFGGGVEVVVPDPMPVDGLALFLDNASQLGLLAVVIVGAGALATDARPEVAAFLRTRIEQAWWLLIPRYLILTAAAAAALVAGTAVTWALTAIVIGSMPAGPLFVGTLYGVLYLAFAVAVLAAVAGLTRTQMGAVFVTIVVLLVLPILGLFGIIKPWLPSELLMAAAGMVAGAPAGEYLRSVAVTVVATGGLLLLAVNRLSRREI